MNSPVLEETDDGSEGYSRWAALLSKTKHDNSNHASRLRMLALTNATKKQHHQNDDNLPFHPVTISPTLVQATDLKYSLKPYHINSKKDPLTKFGYSARPLAASWVEPWDSATMDRKVLPKMRDKKLEPLKHEDVPKKKKKSGKTPKEVSRLHPKYPVVTMPVKEWQTKALNYNDVKMMRKHLNKSYMKVNNKDKNDLYYIRTKKDFYNMELHKLKDVLPSVRSHLKSTYNAYLTITHGSRKAVKECLQETLSSAKTEPSRRERQSELEQFQDIQDSQSDRLLLDIQAQQEPPQTYQFYRPAPPPHHQFQRRLYQCKPNESLQDISHIAKTEGETLPSTESNNQSNKPESNRSNQEISIDDKSQE